MNLQVRIFLKSRFVCTKHTAKSPVTKETFYFYLVVGLTRPKSNIVHKKLRLAI